MARPGIYWFYVQVYCSTYISLTLCTHDQNYVNWMSYNYEHKKMGISIWYVLRYGIGNFSPKLIWVSNNVEKHKPEKHPSLDTSRHDKQWQVYPNLTFIKLRSKVVWHKILRTLTTNIMILVFNNSCICWYSNVFVSLTANKPNKLFVSLFPQNSMISYRNYFRGASSAAIYVQRIKIGYSPSKEGAYGGPHPVASRNIVYSRNIRGLRGCWTEVRPLPCRSERCWSRARSLRDLTEVARSLRICRGRRMCRRRRPAIAGDHRHFCKFVWL